MWGARSVAMLMRARMYMHMRMRMRMRMRYALRVTRYNRNMQGSYPPLTKQKNLNDTIKLLFNKIRDLHFSLKKRQLTP